MRIDPNSKLQGPTKTAATDTKQKASKTDRTSFAASDRLTRQLEVTAKVRADQVARAKALIANPAYPDDAKLRQVGKLLADHLVPPASSD